MSRRAAVVGGGISGLAAARHLAQAGWEVTVCEGAPRFGGKVGPVLVDGVRLDGGAESLLARRPEALDLLTDLGLDAQRVWPTGAHPELLIGGVPRPLPRSVLGVPTDPDDLAGVLSPAGLDRARREPLRPALPLTGDVPIGAYVDDRLGPEVTDRLLEPLLGGVYAGRARELSFAATSPGLYAAARGGGSLLAAARRVARPGGEAGPVFAGLTGGVAGLIDALVADLARREVVLRPNAPVQAVTPTGSGSYRLSLGPAGSVLPVEAEAVVLAVPAGPTSRILRGLVDLPGAWGQLPYASLAVVTLIVRGLAPSPSGLLVPPGELPTIKALTYSSTKWAWVASRAAEAWGPGTAVVRASVGRRGEEALLQLPDDALLARTFAEAAGLPGWESATLVAGAVSRWGGGLPQYQVGHPALVRAVRDAVADRPGLALCGAAYDGVGIAACLSSATLAVDKIDQDFSHQGRRERTQV